MLFKAIYGSGSELLATDESRIRSDGCDGCGRRQEARAQYRSRTGIAGYKCIDSNKTTDKN